MPSPSHRGSSTGFVDLRSDTVTRPTPEMRRAMAEAEVGDDGYGEDPTVNALEEAYAARVGKPAAVFVPSGTMANQIALRVLCRPGGLVVAGRRQHVVIYEAGAAAANAGIQFHPVDDDDGTHRRRPTWRGRSRPPTTTSPTPELVCVEHTHMPAGGIPWTRRRPRATWPRPPGDLPVHMDGARLFNAEVATGIDGGRLRRAGHHRHVVSVQGPVRPGRLGAGRSGRRHGTRPGSSATAWAAAMRQAGVIAAAGLVALRTMVERLAEDHARARRLAEAVAERWPDGGLRSRTGSRPTWSSSPTPTRPARWTSSRAEGILAGTIAPGVRALRHPPRRRRRRPGAGHQGAIERPLTVQDAVARGSTAHGLERVGSAGSHRTCAGGDPWPPTSRRSSATRPRSCSATRARGSRPTS